MSSVVIAVVACLLVTGFVALQLAPPGHAGHDAGPDGQDYVDIAAVPPAPPAPAADADASTGSFTEHCGGNADGRHRNADNMIADPGLPGGAHHTHDYVGNLSTNAFSTGDSLAAAATTCANGDRSTFYWPVLRVLGTQGADAHAVGGGADGNMGTIVVASTVDVRFVGSPVSKVVPMPRFLRATVGDPRAHTDGAAGVAPRWTCTGYENRTTTRYPLCPAGSRVERIFDFPNCWDGRSLDSANHRAHLAAPAANGACPHATFPVPALRITLTYDVPTGADYAIDSFPEQRRDPVTDHADFVDVMTDAEQNQVVACIDSGRAC